MVSVIWNALTPYVTIYLSALVIDELAGSKDIAHLKLLVVVTLVSAAVIALGTALLKKWMESQNAGMWLKVERILSEKMLDRDFVNLDETRTAELLSTIRQNMNSGDWGLCRVITSYETLCSCALTILFGISLTVSLFVSRVPDDNGSFTRLNHPLAAISIIILMLAVTFLAPILNNKSGSYAAKYADSHNLANRLFSFFGCLDITWSLPPM